MWKSHSCLSCNFLGFNFENLWGQVFGVGVDKFVEIPVDSAGSRDLNLNHEFTAEDVICLFLGWWNLRVNENFQGSV